MKIKYKSRPAARKSVSRPTAEPANIADTPEALLLAAVIRQAVEDYAHTAESVAQHRQRTWARYLIRVRENAVIFFDTGLEDFLAHFGVSEIFHADTIRRGLRRVHNLNPVEPMPVYTEIAPFVPRSLSGSLIGGGMVPKREVRE